jgi:hypothetical protein
MTMLHVAAGMVVSNTDQLQAAGMDWNTAVEQTIGGSATAEG